MNVIPASVHFLAKCGFSLSYTLLAWTPQHLFYYWSYKSVTRMYTLAALLLRNVYYPVAIKIRGRVAEINSKR